MGSAGYGQIYLSGDRKMAHRATYEYLVGEIPEGLHIDHLCGVRLCVNPDHLEPVTVLENNRRSPRGKSKKCKNGHDFSGDNLMIVEHRKDGRRYQRCRICHNKTAREYRSRKKYATM